MTTAVLALTAAVLSLTAAIVWGVRVWMTHSRLDVALTPEDVRTNLAPWNGHVERHDVDPPLEDLAQ